MMASHTDKYTQEILHHIRHLSEAIGGRGSCTPQERQAGDYVLGQLRQLGVQDAVMETFQAVPSTYQPYALCFAAALIGTLAAVLVGEGWTIAAAAVLNGLGVWGMLAETEFSPNWTRWLLPKAKSLNVVGAIPPAGPAQRRLVLCAHLDTHRTPVFYSSKTWHRLFSLLVSLTFISMAIGSLAFFAGAIMDWSWIKWLGLLIIPVQTFALIMCLHADFTPYSPGANDNASGVGVTLALAKRLAEQPLVSTEVRLALTGCEEVSAYGMAAYLEAHAQELGKDTFYIILDEVGLGAIKYLSADGLVLKRKTHPYALQIARQAASAHPELESFEMIGIAYTDALVATRRGLVSLTVCTHPGPQHAGTSYWHQMSDTMEHVDAQSLSNVFTFAWEVMRIVDQSGGPARKGTPAEI